MPLTGPAFLLAQNGIPSCVTCLLDLFFFLVICYESALDSDFGRMVAVEMRRVDFYASNLSACCSEAQNDPVRGLCVVATRLPTIIPCA